MRANASRDKEVPRFHWEAQLHMQALFGSKPNNSTFNKHTRGLVAQYSGQRRVEHRTHTTQTRQADASVCVTDPDATPMYSQPGHSRLGYQVHYVVDGGKARVILAALVTPASIMDNTPMLDLARWVRFRWHLGYCDTGPSIKSIQKLEDRTPRS